MFCVAVVASARRARDPKSRKTVRDPVYTAAQAERGKQVYDANCVTCHLAGSGRIGESTAGARGAPLVGTRFVQDFGESKVSALFNKMKRDMPSGRPGTLTDQEYLDVATFVLQRNNFPAGPAELTTEVADTRVDSRRGRWRRTSELHVRFLGGVPSSGPDEILAADERRGVEENGALGCGKRRCGCWRPAGARRVHVPPARCHQLQPRTS